MIIARGYHPEFVLQDGRKIRGADGAELLHDQTGKDWPADSGLLIPFLHTGKDLKRVSKDVRKHFGKGYTPLRGRVKLPPRRLSAWTYVGDVQQASYIRRGDLHHEPGHEHDFGNRKPLSMFRTSAALPKLYKRGKIYRIAGVKNWDWSGIDG